MNAPDKIYVPILPRTEDSIISEHCVGTAWDNKEHITIPDIVEYIRKDALLELAKERYKAIENDNQLSELFKQGVLYELHRVIEKIESL